MRKFTITLLMVLVFGSLSFGQYTAMLQTVTASPNENVSVNLSVTGFTSIGSFQFFIQVDPAVLTFQNVTNFSQPGLSVGSAGGNVITVLWTNTTPYTWANGTLLTLNFKYNGLSCPIAFQPSNCEVVKLQGVNPIILSGTFTDGAVSPFMGNAAQATIGNVSAPLGTVSVPVNYTGFPTNVGSLTQKISYDPAKLTFISATGTGSLTSGLISNVAAGIITIVWTNPIGANINTSQLNLNFSYTTLATTNVSFSTGCVITTAAPVTNIAVTYNNGSVAPGGPITAFASFPVITTAVQGQMVDMPLTLSGMPVGTDNFDLHLTYDNPRMSFIGVFNAMYPVVSNANGSNINISYTNLSAPAVNGQFLVLRFMYNGIGTANVNFVAGCQFSMGATQVGVGYSNGSVSPAPAVVNANIGSVSAVSPSSVAIPVTFTDIPGGTNIGAVTMKIGFDASKLTYVNALNPNNATIQLVGNVVQIAWSSTTPVIVNGATFITLNFNYAASGNAATQIIFKDGCQLANMTGTIVPANWNPGGVNMQVNFTISGYLKYDNSPLTNIPVPNATVYVKDGPEPIPPAVGPVPNVIASAPVAADGFYSVTVPNGSYYLYASSTAAWGGVNQADVINLNRYIANLSPNTMEGNPLRILAGDINRNGLVDNGDVIPLRRRIANLLPNPNYLAPDWIFQNPDILVNGANLPGTDFLGTCSGDVNGTYPF